jgi:hypothetical protein
MPVMPPGRGGQVVTLYCVVCLALAWNGPRHVAESAVVLDGRSLCDDHARPMIKVISERMTGEVDMDARRAVP